MALRIRADYTVVCAAEEPPMDGDILYLDDSIHYAIANHLKGPHGPPGLCWHCKEQLNPDCIRCGKILHLYDEHGQPIPQLSPEEYQQKLNEVARLGIEHNQLLALYTMETFGLLSPGMAASLQMLHDITHPLGSIDEEIERLVSRLPESERDLARKYFQGRFDEFRKMPKPRKPRAKRKDPNPDRH